jgi:hypothetical protein
MHRVSDDGGPRTTQSEPFRRFRTANHGECELMEPPEDVLAIVMEQLERLTAHQLHQRESAAVRLTCSRWRRIHDAVRKTLRLRGEGAMDEAVVVMCGKMPALTKLDLFGATCLTHEGLRAVGELEGLTWLNLGCCFLVRDRGVQALVELNALTWLNLGDCSLVTDEGLRAVAELKALTWLDLDGCSLVTDEGLRAVAELPNLTDLFLTATSVTDAGLRHLSSLEKLVYINLGYCDTSEPAEEELRQRIPGLIVEHEEDCEEESEEDEDPEAE